MKIKIIPYDSNWKADFQLEKEKLLQALDGQNAHIEHIGSTSVEGLGAKPIIDILIGIADFSIVDTRCLEPIIGQGYEHLPEWNAVMPYRRFFRKWDKNGERTHHIHLTELGNEFWQRHLFFRNYLRAHPETREAYFQLKLSLAEQDWKEMDEYASAKTAFIREIESRRRK